MNEANSSPAAVAMGPRREASSGEERADTLQNALSGCHPASKAYKYKKELFNKC